MVKYTIIVVFLGVVAAATICRPNLLAQNQFLAAFISHELLALLAVVMTITFASIANIHMTISRVVANAPEERRTAAAGALSDTRRELNSNAWLLFWTFVVAVVILLVKGGTDDVMVESAANGLALGCLLVNALVFHDIYDTSFAIASSDLSGTSSQDPAS